jgi:hypothetical protein
MRTKIESYIEEHIGAVSYVYHEIVSDSVHIDIHVVDPSEKRNSYTLITSGMSDHPMPAPSGKENYRYTELTLSLPATWPLSGDELKDDSNYWPVRWLKTIARLPHNQNAWVSLGHTVPNGNPPVPFSSATELCCWIVSVPLLFGRQFGQLKVSEEKTINFFSLVAIYQEEMEFKLRKGAQPLIELLLRNGVNETVSPNRKNVCKKRFGFFR